MRGDVDVEWRVFFRHSRPDLAHRRDFRIAERGCVGVLAVGRRGAGIVSAPGGIAAATEIQIQFRGCAGVAVQNRNRADADGHGRAAGGGSGTAGAIGRHAGIISVHFSLNRGKSSDVVRHMIEVMQRAEQHSRLQRGQLHRPANVRF